MCADAHVRLGVIWLAGAVTATAADMARQTSHQADMPPDRRGATATAADMARRGFHEADMPPAALERPAQRTLRLGLWLCHGALAGEVGLITE